MIIETTAEWRAKKGLKLTQLIDGDLRDRKDWESARIEARALYYGDGVQRPDICFEGATNIHAPVVHENIERITPKMAQSFWGSDPHVIVERVPEEFDPEETKLQEKYINWAIDFDIENFFLTTHAWFRNMLLDGVGIVKVRWVTTWRRTCEVHRLKTHYYKGETTATGFTLNEAHREKTTADILDELFGAQSWEVNYDSPDGVIHLTVVEDRRLIEDVRVRVLATSQFVDEVELLVYRPILVKDAPVVEVVEADQLVVPYRTRDVQSARRITHVHKMTVDDIVANARLEKFDPWIVTQDDVVKLTAVAKGRGTAQQDRPENEAFGRQRDEVEGVRGEHSLDHDNALLDVYEVYIREDLDGDGQREELVMQVSPDLNKVLHVTYLDTVHPHGRRPFPTIHFLAPSDRFYVPGLAMFLAPLNIQANITLNQINDRQTLINNPIGFYRPMALPQDPDAMKRLKPGDMVPSPDPGGIVFPDWGKAPLADMSIMSTILAFADRVGSSPLQGGSTSQNTPRTARGTLALISEGNLKVDVLIQMSQKEGFEELLRQLFGLYSTFMADEKYFYATGHDRKRTPEMISRRLMRGNFQFRFTGNSVNTNPEAQRILADKRYQIASLNPLYMQDPVHLRELLRDFLSANSDGTSVERILPDLPGHGAEAHAPMPQEHEIMSMRMHRPVDPLYNDNHLEHMAKIDAFSNSAVFETLDPVAVTLIAQHYNVHKQLAARAQQVAALTAQTAGGAEQSVPQDVGLGNLEGGVQ